MRWLSLALVLLVPQMALATSVVAFTETELMSRADVVVLGSIVSTQTVKISGWVSTLTVLQVHQGVKGAQEGDVVVLETPGGEYEGRTVVMTGAPHFHDGQMLLGFFERHDETLRPIGLNYSIYNVGGATGWNVFRDIHELQLVRHAKVALPAGTVMVNVEPVQDMLDRLRSYVTAQGGSNP